MKGVFAGCLAFFLSVILFFVPAFADSGDSGAFPFLDAVVGEGELDSISSDDELLVDNVDSLDNLDSYEILIDEDGAFSVSDDSVDFDSSFILDYLEQILTVLEEEPESELEFEEVPQLHNLFGDGSISSFSISEQSNYPYTGGGYMVVSTNYGNGVVVVPDPFKHDVFGFVKGSDRVVNLTNSTVSCYLIMGGDTYNARFQRFGELEYQYQTGISNTWRSVLVSSLNDTNIQFLDETGERGIQHPYLTLTDKLLFVFIFMELVIHTLELFRRR